MKVLPSLLGIVNDATGIQAVPFQTTDYAENLPAITYSFYSTNNNGQVEHFRFMTRIHAKSYQECVELSQQLSDALVTYGDETIDGLSIKGNGGGSLIDAETGIPQQINYYDITVRR